MVYYLFLILFVVFYVGVLFLMRYFKEGALTNVIFCLNIVIPYLVLVVYLYFTAGPTNWNFTNALPISNVSQVMFTTCWLGVILPKKVRKYYLSLVALLSLGMFVAPSIGLCSYGLINYQFHPHFLLDSWAHYALSLWGVYLVFSKQCTLELKKVLIGGSIIVTVALTLMIVNVIFDTAFFGLSLNGKHNIYTLVLVDNSYLSALIYFLGLLGIMALGFFYQRFLNKAFKAC